MAILIGRTLKARYRIEEAIGRGGMAEVYRAFDTRRGYPVALKVLREDLAEDWEFLRRFQAEAESLAQLAHQNIVRFYGFEQDGRTAFIIMDYIEGDTLRGRLFERQGTPMAPMEALPILRQVAAALEFAHGEGLLHRDVKPGNIMLKPDGTALLSDFGIAKAVDATTVTSAAPGTPAYMSPEQCRGDRLDARSDVYSLGVVLYEMLAGRRPFTGGSAPDTVTGGTLERVRWEQMHVDPPDPRTCNPALTEGIAQVVLSALAKALDRRCSSARSLYLAFEAACSSPGRGGTAVVQPPLRHEPGPAGPLAGATPVAGATGSPGAIGPGGTVSGSPMAGGAGAGTGSQSEHKARVIPGSAGAGPGAGTNNGGAPASSATSDVRSVSGRGVGSSPTAGLTAGTSGSVPRPAGGLDTAKRGGSGGNAGAGAVETRPRVALYAGVALGAVALIVLVTYLLGQALQPTAVTQAATPTAQAALALAPTRAPAIAAAMPALTQTPTPLPAPPVVATPTLTPTSAPASLSTPAPSATPTASPSPTDRPTATDRPTLAPSVTASHTPAPPTLTPTRRPPTATTAPPPPTVAGYPAPRLLSPAEGETLRGQVTFQWEWSGQDLAADQGFELRLWRDSQPDHYGATGIVRSGTRVNFDVAGAYGVQQGKNGAFYWTVALVEADPYRRIGPEAAPRRVNIEINRGGGGNPGGGGAPTPPPP